MIEDKTLRKCIVDMCDETLAGQSWIENLNKTGEKTEFLKSLTLLDLNDVSQIGFDLFVSELISNGLLDEAFRFLSSGKFMRTHPSSVPFRMYEIFWAKKENLKAIFYIRQAIGCFEENPFFHHCLGLSLAEIGELEEALNHHMISSQLAPLEQSYNINLGHTAYRLGHYHMAVQAYQDAIRTTTILSSNHAIDFAASCAGAGIIEDAALIVCAVYRKEFANAALSFTVRDGSIYDNVQLLPITISKNKVEIIFSSHLQTCGPATIKGVMIRLIETMPFLFYISELTNVSGFHFNLSLGDEGGTSFYDMSFCSRKGGGILIPDHVFIRTNAFMKFNNDVEKHWMEWDDRVPIAFWRGTTTGIWEGPQWSSSREPLFCNLPRLKLASISLQYPKVIDARVSMLLQIEDPEMLDAISRSELVAPVVDVVEFLRYQVQIDIDGNSNSWAGFFQKLLTGSPVVKVESPGLFEQWFYHRLVAWENFVPVRSDMSDLTEKVEFLLNRPQIARRIGDAGRSLAMSMTLDAEFRRVFNCYERRAVEDFNKKHRAAERNSFPI